MTNWDAEKIKALRKSLGLSQLELAHRLGCRQQTISEWELGLYSPANAYGRLLENLKFSVVSHESSWLGKGKIAESKKEEKLEVPELEPSTSEVAEELASPDFYREFDPAID